jgi:hypothetical protein
MAEQRKASDILLDLETEVKSLKSIVNLQDLLLKKILGSCNKMNSVLESLVSGQELTPEQKEAVTEQLQHTTIEPIAISPGFPIEVERDFKGQRRITRGPEVPSTKASNADIEFKDYMAQRKKVTPIDLGPKTTEQAVKSEKKVPVTQRVQDNNKKDLFMAEINLISNEGHVLKTKTNAMGKWQAQLPPGKYLVKVSKMDTALQKKLEAEQDIVVPNSNSSITLPTIIVNRE